jgi:hypothetical protein
MDGIRRHPGTGASELAAYRQSISPQIQRRAPIRVFSVGRQLAGARDVIATPFPAYRRADRRTAGSASPGVTPAGRPPHKMGFTPPVPVSTVLHSFISSMGNLKKKRRLKMSKHKRRKRLKANRHKKRTWQK